MKSGDKASLKKPFENQFLEYGHTNYLIHVPPMFHHCTLNNFDFSDQKPSLIKAIKNFLEGTGKKKGLFLYGSFGIGKTHLLVAMYRATVKKEEDPSESFAFFTSLENIMKEVFKRIDKKDRDLDSPAEYLEFLSEIQWLFLDDITATPLKDYTLEVLRKIINTRYEMQLPTCFAANSDLEQLVADGLHPHAISRITGMCEVIKIQGRDRRRL